MTLHASEKNQRWLPEFISVLYLIVSRKLLSLALQIQVQPLWLEHLTSEVLTSVRHRDELLLLVYELIHRPFIRSYRAGNCFYSEIWRWDFQFSNLTSQVIHLYTFWTLNSFALRLKLSDINVRFSFEHYLHDIHPLGRSL